jgi:hypothetical protein
LDLEKLNLSIPPSGSLAVKPFGIFIANVFDGQKLSQFRFFFALSTAFSLYIRRIALIHKGLLSE